MSNERRNANGEGSLYYDGSRKKWRMQISYRLNDGKLRRKSFSGDNKTDVRNQKKQFEKDLALNIVVVPSKLTIPDILKEDTERDYEIGVIKDNAYIRRVFTYQIIERSEIGRIPISKLTENDIVGFLITIKNKYSNNVISKVYSALGKAYKIAIYKRIVGVNLMDSMDIKKPKSYRKDTKVTAFTVDEQNLFVMALGEKRYQSEYIDYNSMLLIELFAGLRMGEVSALKPEDIDLKNNNIKVTKSVTRDKEYHAVLGDTTKNNDGAHDVPINPILVPILENVLSKYSVNRDGLLFYNRKMDRPVSTQQVNDYFKRVCKKAGVVPQGGQHLLRHTFATRCIESGVPAPVLQKWLGHSDVSITINTYCDVFDKFHDKEMEKVQNYCNTNLIAPKLHQYDSSTMANN